MKYYTLRATTDVVIQNQHVGYLGIDSPSGGYPYNREEHIEFFIDRRSPDHEIKSILDVEKAKGDYSDGGVYISATTGSFLEAFRKITGRSRFAPFSLTFQLLEFDFSNPWIVKTTVLRQIDVEGQEAESYKTRDQAYYKAVERKLG